MGIDRVRNAPDRPVVESVESRMMLSAGGVPGGPPQTGIGGALRGESYRLIVGDHAVGGTLKGGTLVIHAAGDSITSGRGQDHFEVIRVGNNTIGGTVGDPVVLELAGNTIGGVLGADGILFRAGANTIGGTFHPDTYVIRVNTVGGSSALDVAIRVGANTIGGTLGEDDGGPGIG
jgi:hypothetical protein